MKIEIFKIEEFMNEYESRAKYDMTTTCIDSFSLKSLFELTGQNLSEILEKPLHYGDITGSLRLKNNVVSLYENKSEKNVTVTLGGIGGNSLVFLSLLEQGDEVVSIIPTYQQLYSIPKQFGANVKLLKLKPELNWHVDLEELERTVSEKTKLITINNPNNPTGAVLSEFELKNIVEIAKNVGAYVLSDEVYRFLNHDKNSSTVSIADLYDKGISTFSMSKTFSLAGIRVGFVVAEEEIIEKINLQRQYNTISISALDDYIACVALENRDKILDRNLKIVLDGKKILTDWVNCEPKISMSTLEGGTTAFVAYDDPRNSYEFALDLFNDTGVLVLPGDAMEVPKHLRIGYCGETEKFKEGLEKFSKWLNS